MITIHRGNTGGTQAGGWRVMIVLFAVVVSLIALLLGGVAIAVLLAGKFGHLGTYAVWGVIGLLALAILLFLRQNELVAVLLIAVHLYVDFYRGLYFVALILVLLVLAVLYLTDPSRLRREGPRSLWLWLLFLGLCVVPALRGAVDLEDIALYYPNIILGALLLFWLGTILIHNRANLRLFLALLSLLSTFIAIHTIIQELTGITLFASAAQEAFLTSVSNYQLGPENVHRVGSFFSDPDYDGAFLSMMLFLPLGLLVESSSFLRKGFYLAQTSLIFLALLFTYSGTAWVGALAGLVIYLFLVGSTRYRLLLPLCVLGGAIALLVFFPEQVQVLLQHISDSGELALRISIWRASLGTILAFPLSGIGFSHTLFLQIATRYATGAHYTPIDHPHNSYLEFAVMGGIPVLAAFVALLAWTLWQAIAQWKRADVHTRPLIGAGIAAVIALCVCSLATNAWTLPPLAAIGWLILGALTSPLLTRALDRKGTPS
jgi:O-antigen ligase